MSNHSVYVNVQMITFTSRLSLQKKDCGKSYPYSAKKHKPYSIFLNGKMFDQDQLN